MFEEIKNTGINLTEGMSHKCHSDFIKVIVNACYSYIVRLLCKQSHIISL